jgi:hypothetical protein
MNWNDWYTDTVDVYRNVDNEDGNLTRHERKKILTGQPCRIYKANDRPINMSQASASIKQDAMLACDNSADIRTGDELIIHRGGRLGKALFDTRAFAGDPHYYFEPFGAVVPGLAHQEIILLQEERVSE